MPAATAAPNPAPDDVAMPPGGVLPAAITLDAVTPAEAYAYCARLARRHYENFTVGGCIAPKAKLPHIYAVYAWCRMVDDLGDESRPAPAAGGASLTQHRLAMLDWWETELDAIYGAGPAPPRHPVSIAVRQTVAAFDIPRAPFDRLIHANRIDQGSGRFDTLDDVLHYCRHSANPVGHLFLYLFGYDDPERQRLADATCTALQLTNFWQDVARDYRDRNRIYLPQSELAAYGVAESDIAAGRATPAFRALLRRQCDFAMSLFREGAPLVASLDRSARLPVALFTRGGVAVLDAIRRQDYDVLARRPALSKGRKARLVMAAFLGSRLGRGYGLPV